MTSVPGFVEGMVCFPIGFSLATFSRTADSSVVECAEVAFLVLALSADDH